MATAEQTGSTTVKFTFTSLIAALNTYEGPTIDGNAPIGIVDAEPEYAEWEYASPIGDGAVWSASQPPMDISFVNGLPLLPSTGIVNE